MQPIFQQKYIEWYFLLLACAFAVFLYLPGLSGYFVLDDFHILERMRAIGGLNDSQSFWEYVLSGGGGPLGRPLPMVTFALNASDWPADPKPFILTNIFLHILTSIVVYLTLRTVLATTMEKSSGRLKFISLMAAIIWMTHPFHASTVLYVVQRMSIMSTMFSLLAILFYIKGRAIVAESSFKVGITYWLVSFMFSLAAVFCKENAILIPVLVLLIEIILLPLALNAPRVIACLRNFVLVPSSLIVVVFLMEIVWSDLWYWYSVGELPKHGRTFNALERIAVQGGVLWSYFLGFALPKMSSAGVFYDQPELTWSVYSVSKAAVQWFLHIVCIFLAVKLRRRIPIYSFGVLWFYICHSLESSVVMLELRFDHRNYLPSLGLAVAISAAIYDSCRHRYRIACSVVVLTLLAGFLYMSSTLWGKPLTAAMVWASENPRSPRAQEAVAKRALVLHEDISLTKKHLRQAIKLAPYAAIELKYILAFCDTYNSVPPDWEAMGDRLASEPRNWVVVRTIRGIFDKHVRGECRLADYAGFKSLIRGLKKNPLYANDASFANIAEVEYKIAAHFHKRKDLYNLEFGLDLRGIPLMKTSLRAGYLAGQGFFQLAIMRLSEAIELAQAGLLPASERDIQDAVEVLGLIEVEAKK